MTIFSSAMATYSKFHYTTLWSMVSTIFYRQVGYSAYYLYCTAYCLDFRPNLNTVDGIGNCVRSFVRFWPNLEWGLRFFQRLKKFVFIKHSSIISSYYINHLNLAVTLSSTSLNNQISTWCSLCGECFFYGKQNKQRLLLYSSLTDLFL